MRSIRLLAQLAVLLSMLLVASCASEADDAPGDEDLPLRGVVGRGGSVSGDTAIGEDFPVGGFPMCLQSGGPVDLIEVVAKGMDGPIRMVGAYARDYDGALALLEPGKPLPADFVPIERYRLVGDCHDDDPFAAEAVIVVERTGPGDGFIKGFDISYQQDGHDFASHWPTTIAVCDGVEPATVSSCED